MGDEFHISSLVVHALAPKVPAVRDAIGRLRGAEIHAVTPDGRIVVTLESVNEADILTCTAEIRGLAGVVSVALVFHQAESG